MPDDATAALAAALQETILTATDRYMGPGMGAYRTPYGDLTPAQQRHVQQDAIALLDALAAAGYRITNEPPPEWDSQTQALLDALAARGIYSAGDLEPPLTPERLLAAIAEGCGGGDYWTGWMKTKIPAILAALTSTEPDDA